MGIPERKEREKVQRKEEIVHAARTVFFEKGLQVTTMDDVAAAAELSKGTLYLYYKSKEELYLAVAMEGMKIMYDMFVKATSTGEPTIKLIINLGDAYYEFFKQHRKYFRMFYFSENLSDLRLVSPEVRALCTETDSNVWGLVSGLMKRAVQEGLFHKNIDPMEASVILWSNSNGIMRLMDRGDELWKERFSIDLESILEKSNAFIVEGMLTERAKKEYASYLTYHPSEEDVDGKKQ